MELTEGVGLLQLRDGVRMEMRSGADDTDNSVLVMNVVPELEAGDLLVAAPGRTEVEAAGTKVQVSSGAAQVSRRLGMGVAAYDAAVLIDSAGEQRPVPALREMQVPALGRPPQAPRPVVYDDRDAWDRRYLGAAIELGTTLEALATGYTSNLDPQEGRTPGFFRIVLPGLDDEPEFGGDLLEAVRATTERPPGETLVGAAISELGRNDTFAQRWSEVFTFRDQGAAWGIVALDQAVSATPLLGTVEEAIGSSPLTFIDELAAPPTPGAVPPPVTTVPPQSAPPPSTPTTRPPQSPSPTDPPPTSPPTTDPPPTEVPEVPPALEPVVNPVTDIVGDLVGGLLGGLVSP